LVLGGARPVPDQHKTSTRPAQDQHKTSTLCAIKAVFKSAGKP
jgi:hypothetical protein